MSAWEERYQRGETGWDRGGVSPALTQLVDHLHLEARVLVPGCGRGHEVIELARLGFKVTAIDIAPSAIAHLSQQLQQEQLDAELVNGDLFAYAPDQRFDAVYEQTCLCAIEPEQRADYEQRLHGWLKPEGVLYALFMQTGVRGGPPFHCDLIMMRELFDASRWQWPVETGPVLVLHKNGRFELGHMLRRAGK